MRRPCLQPNEAAQWLTWDDPSKPSPRTPAQNQMIMNALKNPNQTVAQLFGKQTVFWVPNRVFAYWGGVGESLGRSWVGWDKNMAALIKKGYRVSFDGYRPKVIVKVPEPKPTGNPEKDRQNYVNYMQAQANADWTSGKKNGWVENPMATVTFLDKLKVGTSNKILQGVIMWSHGGPDGVLLNANAK